MKTHGLLLALVLTVSGVPVVLGMGPAVPVGEASLPPEAAQRADPAAMEALQERLVALEALLAQLLGPGTPVQNACPSGIGCFKVPGVVDESGDTMFGALNMDRSKILFIPQGATDGGASETSYINGTDANLRMPIDYFSELRLLQGSKLNTTNQSEVFIDFAGNLTFADGSFLNPFGSVFEHDVVYNSNVTIFENITIHEGATMVFQNNTSIILSGAASRIGTEDETPFVIIVNNTTAITIFPQNQGALVQVNGSVVPEVDDFYALGSPTNRWDALYMASTIDFANDLLYTSGGITRMTLKTDGTLELPGTLTVGTLSTTTAITGESLAAGSITPDRLADVCFQGQVLKTDDGEWVCDDDLNTQYGAAAGLLLTGTDFAPDYGFIQARVLGTCAEGASIRAIAGDGTVVCETDDGTIYTAGTGLGLTGNEFSVDFDAVQARVLGSCIEGTSIAAILVDGSVVCESDSDTTYVAGTGLVLTGTTFSADLTTVQARLQGECSPGSSIRAIDAAGNVDCEVDDDQDTLGNLVCGDDQLVRFVAQENVWVCGDDIVGSDTLASLSCDDGQTVKWYLIGGVWQCAEDLGTTYAAGAGLQLVGTEFSIDETQTQKRVTGSCTGGAIKTINTDGTVACESISTNAQTLDGIDSSQFLRSDVADTFTASLLTLNGGLKVGAGAANDDDSIFFDDGAAEFLRWNDALGRFQMSDDLELQSDLFLGGLSATDNDHIYFDTGTSRFLQWDDAQTRFEFNGELALSGPILVGGITDGNQGFSRFCDASCALTESGDMGVDGDAFVEDALEVGSRLYLSKELFMEGRLATGGDGDQTMYFYNGGNRAGEFLRFDDAADQFQFTNDLFVREDLTVGGFGSGDDDSIFFDSGMSQWLRWQDAIDTFALSNDLRVFGELSLSNSLRVGDSSPSDDDFIFMDAGAAHLRWNEAAQRFEFSKDLSVPGGPVQVRVTGSCAGGGISSISATGSVTCDADDDTLQTLSCATNQVIRWSGSAWVCAANTMPARPGPGVTVKAFDADRDAELKTLVGAEICYFDSNGNTVFNTGEPIYLKVSGVSCVGAGPTVASKDLRLVPAAGFGAWTQVRAVDPDFGNPLRSYAPAADGVKIFDADGDGGYSVGDWVYADRDANNLVSINDYRWIAAGSAAAATVVTAGSSDVNLPLSPVGGLGTVGKFWSQSGTATVRLGDMYYLDLVGAGAATTSIGDVRLGDLGLL